jgi:hypothetical protein
MSMGGARPFLPVATMPWVIVHFWRVPVDRTKDPQTLSLPLGPNPLALYEDCYAWYRSTHWDPFDSCADRGNCRRPTGEPLPRSGRGWACAYVGVVDRATGDVHFTCYVATCCKECGHGLRDRLVVQLRADFEEG